MMADQGEDWELVSCPFCDGTGEHVGQGLAVDLLAGKLPKGEGFIPARDGNTVCSHCQGVGDTSSLHLKWLRTEF